MVTFASDVWGVRKNGRIDYLTMLCLGASLLPKLQKSDNNIVSLSSIPWHDWPLTWPHNRNFFSVSNWITHCEFQFIVSSRVARIQTVNRSARWCTSMALISEFFSVNISRTVSALTNQWMNNFIYIRASGAIYVSQILSKTQFRFIVHISDFQSTRKFCTL